MIANGNKEVEKESSTNFHFLLHRAAAFKSASAADDEGEIVSAKTRVRVRRVCISKSSAMKNRSNLDASLEGIFTECDALKHIKAVGIRGTVYSGVTKNCFVVGTVVDNRGRNAGANDRTRDRIEWKAGFYGL
jgi:hypothetical protein